MIPAVQRGLVATKFRYMGDTIVATPFLQRLREAFPQARVTLLTGPAAATALAGCPHVEEIWVHDPRVPGEAARIQERIQTGRFDTVFLLNRSLQSAWWAWRARIPARIGFATEFRGALLTHRARYDWERPDRDCALDLLRVLGIPAEDCLPRLWVTPEEEEEARAMLESLLPGPGSWAAIQPGANDPEVRQWGAARFAEVADRLAKERGLRIAICGTREERPVAEEVAERMEAKPVVLAGETGLRQALAVLRCCRLWVGNDGGMLHAAVALGPATVGIFGPTKARRWGYDAPTHRTVTAGSSARRMDAAEIRRALDSIPPERVYRATIEALEHA